MVPLLDLSLTKLGFYRNPLIQASPKLTSQHQRQQHSADVKKARPIRANSASAPPAIAIEEERPLNKYSCRVTQPKEGIEEAGLVGFRFNTIGVSDAISMGTEGMSYSLQSRDLIADSIETVMDGQWYDANISIPGCDKNVGPISLFTDFYKKNLDLCIEEEGM